MDTKKLDPCYIGTAGSGTIFGAINLGLALLVSWQRRKKVLNLPLILGATIGGLIAPVSTGIWQCFNWLCLRFNKSHWLFILSVGWGAFALHESRPSETQEPSCYVYMAEQYDSRIAPDAGEGRLKSAKMAERSFYTPKTIPKRFRWALVCQHGRDRLHDNIGLMVKHHQVPCQYGS